MRRSFRFMRKKSGNVPLETIVPAFITADRMKRIRFMATTAIVQGPFIWGPWRRWREIVPSCSRKINFPLEKAFPL